MMIHQRKKKVQSVVGLLSVPRWLHTLCIHILCLHRVLMDTGSSTGVDELIDEFWLEERCCVSDGCLYLLSLFLLYKIFSSYLEWPREVGL